MSATADSVDESLVFQFDEAVRQADQLIMQGQPGEALERYQRLLAQAPDHPYVVHNLGLALSHLGRYAEAELYLRRAIEVQPNFPEAHGNLGIVLRALGRLELAESAFKVAAEADPDNETLQCNLGEVLLLLGRPQDAEACFAKVRRAQPGHLGAALGLGEVARLEGRFRDAEAIYRGILQDQPNIPAVWALLPSLRQMTTADAPWLTAAEELASSATVDTLDNVRLRFAIGKYWDDLGEFSKAFQSCRFANELLKQTAKGYNRAARVRYVQDMMSVYSAEAVAHADATRVSSPRPIFVVGMPRSGTSLVEQIIASHPAAYGAGELGFWTEVMLSNAGVICTRLLPEPRRKEVGADYLRLLRSRCGDASHVVDKAPVNAEYLGLIHSVLPDARIIYMRRDPIDTCLSCYFQYLSPALSYTMDLSDLAHYYRTHHQLMTHWRSVLPRGAILDVPYEELVDDQETWTRKILAFIGLPWDERCLEFHKTRRPVATASSWQVRQKIYKSSVQRWRNYQQFLGPLLELSNESDQRKGEPRP
jgi:Flp pilus assembly protein TadD